MKLKTFESNENAIQAQIISYLRFLENSGQILFERTNAGKAEVSYSNIGENGFFGKSKKRFVQLGRAGTSDIKVYTAGGKTYHLEVKRAGGKQNENQKQWQAKLEKLGHFYAVVFSVEDVRKIIEGARNE